MAVRRIAAIPEAFGESVELLGGNRAAPVQRLVLPGGKAGHQGGQGRGGFRRWGNRGAGGSGGGEELVESRGEPGPIVRQGSDGIGAQALHRDQDDVRPDLGGPVLGAGCVFRFRGGLTATGAEEEKAKHQGRDR